MTTIVAVVAAADNGVIGRDKGMVWQQTTDLKRFKAITLGKPVIMGRKSFEALGCKPLPGRRNIILTRNRDLTHPQVEIVHTPEEALAVARRLAGEMDADEISILGGGEVYALMMPYTDIIQLTEVHAQPEGDAFFPKPDPAVFEEVWREDHPAGPGDDHPFSFVELRRRAGVRSSRG
jgi:dihydrofolate reductase